MEPNFDTNEPPIKVVTTLGAAVLTGRTHEAVRQAIQQGRVEVAAELLLGKHPDRLLELDSVTTYWEVPQTQLRGDVVLDSHGECWQVMTPLELAAVFWPKPVAAAPLWFRSLGREDRAQ